MKAIPAQLLAFPGGARGAALAAAVAAAAAWIFHGFTVDDALVTARVASHLANGDGYRFNIGGPPVDAVTPLGWAPLLAGFGKGTPLEMLERARVLGVVAWLAAAGLLGALAPSSRRSRALLLGGLGLLTPLAAWASAGMETGFVTGLATLGLLPAWPAALATGLAAAFRPELLPWCVTLAAGHSLATAESARGRLLALMRRLPLALGPALAVGLVRHAWFGSFAPLSAVAKAPDLAHGAFYAFDAALGTGIPLLLIAPSMLARADGRTRALAAAVAAHFLALIAAGGDWMALYRLAVPVLPSALLAAARLAEGSSSWSLSLRAAAFSLRPLWVAAQVAWPGRAVLTHRLELIERARPSFGGAHTIACLDIGWVGAATNARLVDLAGITDPVVARLPGGHTTKRISNGLLENRDVDTVVLLLAPGAPVSTPWQESAFARGVEARVAALPALEAFRMRVILPLGGTTQSYLVVGRAP